MTELYILNKKGDCFVLLSHCFELYVSCTNAIRAISVSGTAIILGEYSNYNLARAALRDLLAHAPAGGTYQLPDDDRAQVLLRASCSDSPEKFAGNGKKPVRRGGS